MKFRLASNLHEKVNMDRIVNKVFRTEVTLDFDELLAVSPELSEKVEDAVRRKRQPVPNVSTVNAGVASTTVETEPLYACVSGKAKVTVDDGATVDALLDGGSEVCLMPRRVFERLDLPIDTEINWQINAYDQSEKTRGEKEEKGVIGVCHNVRINLGGVEAILPIFIVGSSNSDLLLGRPWERQVRAQYDNRADGSLWVTIRSTDGRRVVKFCAAKAEHERNRYFVRPPGDALRSANTGKA